MFLQILIRSAWGVSLLALSLGGYGDVLLKVFAQRRGSGVTYFFTSIWTGLCVVILLGNIWNLGAALTSLAAVLIFGIGLVLGLATGFYRRVLGLLISGWRDDHLVVVLITVVLFLFLVGKSVVSPANYDSGLYHLNAIRWLNDYGVVPGLGNLHGRLAFNQSIFTFDALVNRIPFLVRGWSLVNPFLFFIALEESLAELYKVFRAPLLEHGMTGVFPKMLIAFSFPALIHESVSYSLSAPAPDLFVFVSELVVVWHLARLAMDMPDYKRSARWEPWFILIFAVTLVTCKLSTAGFVIGVLLVLAALTLKDREAFIKRGRAPMAVAFAVACLVGCIWILRGYILSGYPMYPSTTLGMDLSWRVPRAAARSEARWVTSWARWPKHSPDTVLGNWLWLKPWLRRLKRRPIVVVLLMGTGVSFLLWLLAAGLVFVKKHRRRAVQYVLIAIPVWCGVATWFSLAPAPRFAGSMFWIALLLPLSWVGSWLVLRRVGLLLAIVFVIMLGSVKPVCHIRWSVTLIGHGFQPVRKAALVWRTTHSGLRILTPVHGDQCWDSPLPCTPRFNPSLALRGKTLQSGFIVVQRPTD